MFLVTYDHLKHHEFGIYLFGIYYYSWKLSLEGRLYWQALIQELLTANVKMVAV